MNSSRLTLTTIVVALLSGVLLPACSTSPEGQADRDDLVDQAELTASLFRRQDPSLEHFFDESVGYAVFPSIGKGGAIVGGAFGRGVLYEDGRPVGFCKVTQGDIGLQLGGQSFSEIIFFQDDRALSDFKLGQLAFSAQASAVAATEGAAAQADYSNGVAVFTMVRGGLMFEAAVGGQGFEYEPF